MILVVSQKNGPHGLLLVITDKEIFGQIFTDGKKQLDLTKKFFEGEEMEKARVEDLCATARDIIFTGKQAVALGVERDLIDATQILWVQDIPHAQVAH